MTYQRLKECSVRNERRWRIEGIEGGRARVRRSGFQVSGGGSKPGRVGNRKGKGKLPNEPILKDGFSTFNGLLSTICKNRRQNLAFAESTGKVISSHFPRKSQTESD